MTKDLTSIVELAVPLRCYTFLMFFSDIFRVEITWFRIENLFEWMISLHAHRSLGCVAKVSVAYRLINFALFFICNLKMQQMNIVQWNQNVLQFNRRALIEQRVNVR